MSYVKVRWIHDDMECPVWIYSELDGKRRETRKVEFFLDGSVEWADATTSPDLVTALSEEPLPPHAEIAANPEFELTEISREEFEKIWLQAKQQS